MDSIDARHHTFDSLGRLMDAGNAESLAQWCEWNDPYGDYREENGTLWHIGDYWCVISDAFDQ